MFTMELLLFSLAVSWKEEKSHYTWNKVERLILDFY